MPTALRERTMPGEQLPLGIFTTDDRLVVRSWDRWLADATGIAPGDALNRPLVDVIPDLAARGLLHMLENVLARGSAEVLAPAIHHYLIPCPPSQSSGMFDRMQQHVTIGPLREDHKVVGVIVTVEDVTARVEREHALAASLGQEDAAVDRVEDVSTHQQIDSLAHLLGAEDWRVRRTAVSTLASHGHAIIDALVRTLREQHANLSMLSSALDLLAISNIDVIEPLIGFLEDEDANLRMQAALILGDRRDRRAVPALIRRLGDPDVNVRFHVIEALGHLRAMEACEALVQLAEERNFFLAFPAIQALSRLGNSAVAPRLVPLLEDELLRAPVIEALGELGDEDMAMPLARLLNASEAPTEVITDALAGLYDRYESRYGAGEHIAGLVRRSLTATATQKILDAVQRVGADRLAGLAKVLGWLEGSAAQRALTRLLGHASVRSQVVEALVRNGAGVVALLAEQLKAEDLETRQAAAVALGRIGDRRAAAALIEALSDREVAVAAAGALARIGDAAAFEPLMRLLGDTDSAIRQAAIAALNSIGHPAMPERIAGLLASTDATVRESALRIAGYFGYAQCREQVLALCNDPAHAVRRAAIEQLPFFDDARVFDHLDRALDDDVPAVRAAVASALARVEHPLRVAALLRALRDTDPWVRYVALKSLSATADPSVVSAVFATVENDDAPHVRLAAIDVIGRLKPENAVQVLEPLTQSPNLDVADAAIRALGYVDGAGALAVLQHLVRAPELRRRATAVDTLKLRSETQVPQILQWIAASEAAHDVVRAALDGLAHVALRQDRQGAEATGALIALTAEPTRRSAAIATLASLPVRRVADIAGGLHHPARAVRRACVEALGQMKHVDASRALASALDDADATVRLAAVAELKHLGTRAAQDKLMALARLDPDSEVRHAAMMAVARSTAESPADPAASG